MLDAQVFDVQEFSRLRHAANARRAGPRAHASLVHSVGARGAETILVTAEQLFALGRDAVMLVIMVLVFYWGKDRKQVADAIETQFKLRDRDILDLTRKMESFEQSMDRAREKSSELAGDVQHLIGRIDRMPEELREKFLSVDRAHDLIEESRRDRKNIWDALERRKEERRRE